MGVLDFIRDAGEKLTELGEEAKLATRIEKRIISLGAKIKGLNVDIDGEMAVLKGIPASEDDREKAVQIAGNVRGISRVSDRMSYKGEHSSAVKQAKPVKKKVKPVGSSGKRMKEPKHGGRKVRPPELSRKKVKSAKSMKRRTP